MKKIVLFFILLAGVIPAFATHIAGGEIFYKRIGPGVAPNSDIYKVTVRLFRQCDNTGGSGAALTVETPNVGIYNSSGLALVTNIQLIAEFSGAAPFIQNDPAANPCLTGSGTEVLSCYQVGTWSGTIELPQSASGYTLAWSRYTRRSNGVVNVSVGGETGATFITTIPGTNIFTNAANSSPEFVIRDTALVCKSSGFSINYSATDADGDSLAYKFSTPYEGYGGSSANPNPFSPTPPSSLVLTPMSYNAGYSANSPLGASVSLNVNTGVLSGTAPAMPGYYVICVIVEEWRNGVKLNDHRKDFVIKIGNCSSPKPNLGLDDRTCNGFTFTFSDSSNSSSSFTSYAWTFGDGGTSSQPVPTHTYIDTGRYKVQLKVTASGGCQDSSFKYVYVFPGFVPNFNILDNCFQSPIRFQDATTTAYGFVNSWSWDFGDLTTQADTSHIKNPSYQYPAAGTYSIRLVSTNSKGCVDDTTKTWNVLDKPIITLPFKDTLICSIDTLPLIANTTGSVLWTPNYNIINPTSNNPLVYPKVTTTYKITVNNSGCVNSDSIKVNVLDFITVDAGRDTTICLTDTVRLKPTSQALSYIWSSSTGEVVQPTKFPLVKPMVQTIYRVTANLGKCQDKDSVIVKVAPYPMANAGADKTICFADNVQLNGTYQGAFFSWSPTTFLSNANTLTPIASPRVTINYVLTANDTVGCPKPVRDTVQIVVIPKVKAFAGRDTTVIVNQPLQLNASGAVNFAWSPITGLSNPNIANPIAILGATVDSIKYIVTASTPEGCTGTDDIVVKVFKTGPEIFVPSGFTPNGDFKNDILKPILVGMQSLTYFRVYNRWGQLLFQTSQIGRGWDGTVSGTPQQSGTFVYMAEAVDYLGNTVFRKGTVVLIR
jgi:gliding motility-associated-like protein